MSWFELRASTDVRDPGACRARAERWFSHIVMAQNYVRMYQHYVETMNLPAGERIS